jgi:hypothetical protein
VAPSISIDVGVEGRQGITSHRIGTREEWLAARAELLEVRDKLPLVTSQNASATGTNVDRTFFSEGHGLSTVALAGDTSSTPQSGPNGSPKRLT